MTPDDDEPKDWEPVEEEKIPESLQRRWNDYVKEGLRAGVCRSCGHLFTEDDLSCPACGTWTDIPRHGVVVGLWKFLTATPWGFVTLLLIITAVAAYLFSAY